MPQDNFPDFFFFFLMKFGRKYIRHVLESKKWVGEEMNWNWLKYLQKLKAFHQWYIMSYIVSFCNRCFCFTIMINIFFMEYGSSWNDKCCVWVFQKIEKKCWEMWRRKRGREKKVEYWKTAFHGYKVCVHIHIPTCKNLSFNEKY